MQDYQIALWSFNLGRAPETVSSFAGQIEDGMKRAAAGGAKLLQLPEYLIECCLAFKPEGLRPDQEMGFLADTGRELLALLTPVPEKYGDSSF